MKTKTYKFTLSVETSGSKSSARLAVLSAFAKRQPDGCSFNLSDYKKPKVIVVTEIIRQDPLYNP